jgi:hypothetical protein
MLQGISALLEQGAFEVNMSQVLMLIYLCWPIGYPKQLWKNNSRPVHSLRLDYLH